jgi:hypothetical protein
VLTANPTTRGISRRNGLAPACAPYQDNRMIFFNVSGTEEKFHGDVIVGMHVVSGRGDGRRIEDPKIGDLAILDLTRFRQHAQVGGIGKTDAAFGF